MADHDAHDHTGVPGVGGKELNYVANTTSTTNITATTEATANTLVTAGAVSYNGSTVAIIEFFCPLLQTNNTTGASVLLWLYDGSSSIGAIGGIVTTAAAFLEVPVFCSVRITPSNASHTYSVRASTSTGTGVANSGAGGAGVFYPMYIRQTRA